MMTNRWIIALAGMLLMMSLGAIYSWSLYTQPLIYSFGWSMMTTTCAFSLAIFFLGIGALAGGRFQDRVGPRKVALAGVALWGLGNILAGLGTPTFGAGWLYLTYGAMGGFGVGMAYVTPVAVVTKWFPDRRGLGSGIVVAGFGLGAVVCNLVVKSISSFSTAAAAAAEYAKAAQSGDFAAHMLLPEQMHAVLDMLTLSGIAFLLVGGLGAWFLVNPPATSPAAGQAHPTPGQGSRSYTTREMLATREFYLLWLMLFINVAAGILVISNALPILQELTGASPKVAAAAYGGVALFNALGRVLWGALSDRIGRGFAYSLIFVLQAGVFFVMGDAHSLFWAVTAYAVILLCYGGGFGIMPSFTADYFGMKHMGANYGAILTAWGAAGVAGPLFVAEVKDLSGAFSGALPAVATMLALATLLPLVTRKPAPSHGRVFR
ncbi:MAG: OFA family MFS transporter [Caldimonas sp.]